MAKGDDSRARNRIDYEGGIAQNMLTNQRNEYIPQNQAMWNAFYGGPPAGSPALVGTQPGQGGPHHEGTPPPGGQGQDYQAIFNNIFPGKNITSDDLKNKEAELARYGIKLVGPNAAGHFHKIELPDGSRFDVIGGVERGENNKQWLQSRTSSGVALHGGGGGSPMMSGGGALGQAFGDYGNIMGRFAEFADTGGFSPADLANIRSRALSPIRASHSSAMREMARQKALQGGYSPNYTAALAKLNRTRGQALSDAAIGAESDIAQMVQRGRLAGMSGMAGMYGATPGLANMLGNQFLRSQDQRIAQQGLQNQLGLGIMGNQIAASGIPGRWEHTMGRIGDVASIGAPVVGAFRGSA